MKELVIKDELKGIDDSKAMQIEAVFAPMVTMLKGFEGQYDEVMALEISHEACAKAKRVRLDISRIRIDTEKARKIQKEEYLRAGQAIDGVAKIVRWAITDKEEKLKDRELHYERIEEEKIKLVQAEREEELQKYGTDGSSIDLGNMADDIWNNFLTGTKTSFEAVRAAERKAEEDRIEEERKEKLYQERKDKLIPYAQFGMIKSLNLETTDEIFEKILTAGQEAKEKHEAEQEEIRLENLKLQGEKEKAEKEKQKAEAKRKKELQAEEAKRKVKEDELRKEREDREALEKKIADGKAEVERTKKAAEKAKKEALRKAELAPDKEKLLKAAAELLALTDNVKSEQAKIAIKKAYSILSNSAKEL